jgi:hypothetical protein
MSASNYNPLADRVEIAKNSTRAIKPQARLSRTFQLRQAVLFTLCEFDHATCDGLLNLSNREWTCLLQWLDTSGLALYFFERLTHCGQLEILPTSVLTRLTHNLAENQERTTEMIAESVAIQRAFDIARFSYAVLKGFSLWPLSTPRMELRSQLDLDFLLSEHNAKEARQILEVRGYRLKAISGRSWEFKADEDRIGTLKDLYKAGRSLTVELHLESERRPLREDHISLLSRTQQRRLHGMWTPVLCPVDLFLGQGLHLYKHLCSESARTAHLLEFYRHVVARYRERAFWGDLRESVTSQPGTSLKLGVVLALIAHTMGEFAPEALTCWTVDTLPPGALRWIELYGSRTVLASFPGTKLYLLLEEALASSGVNGMRPLRQSLFPYRLPPAIAPALHDESFFGCMKRYRRQASFLALRFRFHSVEGLRYLVESYRWRHFGSGQAQ